MHVRINSGYKTQAYITKFHATLTGHFLQYFSNNISLQFASFKPQNVLQGTKINNLGKEKKRKKERRRYQFEKRKTKSTAPRHSR